MVAIFVFVQERDQLKNTITYLLPDLALTYPKYQLWSCSSVDPYSFLSSYLPSLPLPPLSFLPFSPSTRWTTNRNGVSSSDAKPSKLTYSQAAWGLGTSLHVYRTAFATTEGAPLSQSSKSVRLGFLSRCMQYWLKNHWPCRLSSNIDSTVDAKDSPCLHACNHISNSTILNNNCFIAKVFVRMHTIFENGIANEA